MNRGLALIKCTHPLPCLAVSSFAAVISFSHSNSIGTSLVIFIAVLLQQISVGLSNDWLDYKRDKAAARTDKPAVSGLVRVSQLRVGSLIAAGLAETLAIYLGLGSAIAMLLMLIFGWSYNLGMKNNWSSPIPYALGFGALPIFTGLADPQPYWVPIWIVIVAALLGVSAHFANALPDQVADKLTGVNALPHILGKRVSSVVIGVAAMVATVITVTQSPSLPTEIAIAGLVVMVLLIGSASLLSLRASPPRIVFIILIAAALVNVILLVLGAPKY
ncbi:MAG: UbiA family prenyltransferase [Rhodoluna sp.]|nr:UbiA family prenyltransferase [Rhodoluna sp.]